MRLPSSADPGPLPWGRRRGTLSNNRNQPIKETVMRTTSRGFIGAALLALTLAGCSDGQNPLPQADTPSDTSTTQSVKPKAKAPAKPKVKVTTCDVAREAILTGSKTQIKTALKALQKDKHADATAREYAQNYLVRDAGDPSLQSMDIDLIRMSCTL